MTDKPPNRKLTRLAILFLTTSIKRITFPSQNLIHYINDNSNNSSYQYFNKTYKNPKKQL